MPSPDQIRNQTLSEEDPKRVEMFEETLMPSFNQSRPKSSETQRRNVDTPKHYQTGILVQMRSLLDNVQKLSATWVSLEESLNPILSTAFDISRNNASEWNSIPIDMHNMASCSK